MVCVVYILVHFSYLKHSALRRQPTRALFLLLALYLVKRIRLTVRPVTLRSSGLRRRRLTIRRHCRTDSVLIRFSRLLLVGLFPLLLSGTAI